MVRTTGNPDSREKSNTEHGMDYDKRNRGFAPRYENIRFQKSFYTTPQTRKSSKVAAIESYILQKYHSKSGVDLEKHEDEFIERVKKAGINHLNEKDADELTDKNYHTARKLLARHNMARNEGEY